MAEYNSPQTFTLAPLYKGWQEYQQLLIKALAPLSPEQLNLRAAPELRSIYDIAAHIIRARSGWLFYTLKVESEDLVLLTTWGREGEPVRTAAELVSGLETSMKALQDGLQRWTIADLEDQVEDIEDDGTVETFTRQWVIWHLIEHDLHHGGEISFSLGMYGLAAIDI